MYYIDEENNIRREYTGSIDYRLNDTISLLRIENTEKSHYVYIKHIDRLFNLHHQHIDKDKRFCPICSGKVKLCDYTKHMQVCLKFATEGSMIKLPPADSTMKFKNYKKIS